MRAYPRLLLALLLSALPSLLSFPKEPPPQQPIYEDILAALILKMSNEIEWDHDIKPDTFTIGVYGTEPLILTSLRKIKIPEIKGKKVQIVQFKRLNKIYETDILFIDILHNSEIEYINLQLENTSTLILTDRLPNKKEVMINFYPDEENRIQFEINSRNLEAKNITITPKLLVLGGTELDIRKLYLETEKNLLIEQSKVAQIADQLKDKELELEGVNFVLANINELVSQQQVNFIIQEEKLRILMDSLERVSLKTRIQSKVLDSLNHSLRIGNQDKDALDALLLDKNSEVEAANLKLGGLTSEIKNQELILQQQSIEIETLRKTRFIIFLSLILLVLLIISIVYAYWVRHQKNKEIEAQAELLRQQTIHLRQVNAELELHKNHLEDVVQQRTLDLELAKKKAEESDRLKSSFLANMSHEIRTPMNAIVGFSSLIRNEDLKQEEQQEYINFIHANTETLTVLIDDILDISLIESNQLVLSQDNFDAIPILKERCDYYKMNKPESITVIYENENDENQLILFNDSNRFRQIISNLLDNAIKYTDSGEISFGYLIENDRATFHVRDTGIGIEETEFENIFNHFRKIERTKRLYRGAGIGLAICKKLVEMMGGKIWLDSIPEKGSSFYFTLPYDPQPKPLIPVTKDLLHAQNFGDLNILIVEDDPTNYRLAARILKNSQGTIHWAQDGEEAVRFMEDKTNDSNYLILMDIKMPGMDGFEAHRQIRKLNSTVPIIAVTAYAQPSDILKIKKEQFSGYLTKPYKPQELLSMIASFIKQ